MADIKIQLNALEGSLWFSNNTENLSESDIAEIRSFVGDYWWTDNDQITMFTMDMDGEYSCERRKKVWSYRNGTYTYTNYKFISPTKEEAKEFSELLLSKFNDLRIRRLQAQADKVSGVLAKEYNGILATFKSYRNRMLIDTDWSQLLDAPISDEDRELYKTFRQYLRDMPQDPAWMGNDVFQVDFPITPKDYLEKYPNREVEYLSVPEHFENHAAMQAKMKMTRVFGYLNLPLLQWDENASYEELKSQLDHYLKKIDGNLKFNINVIPESDEIPAPTAPSTNYTIDDINNAAS